ncbi:MAG: hypothetical protein ACI9BW_002513 [Gammaproteobacteria bacterium]|jgi:hypothetical protein
MEVNTTIVPLQIKNFRLSELYEKRIVFTQRCGRGLTKPAPKALAVKYKDEASEIAFLLRSQRCA